VVLERGHKFKDSVSITQKVVIQEKYDPGSNEMVFERGFTPACSTVLKLSHNTSTKSWDKPE
jgi:hypothetical protein